MKKICMFFTVVLAFCVGQYSECAMPWRGPAPDTPREWNPPSRFGNITIPTEKYKREFPLHAQVMLGNALRVAELAKDRSLIDSRDSAGNTPLHIAARGCNPEIVKILLSAGAVADVKSSEVTPLLIAISMGCESVAKLLLEAGVNPDQEIFRPNRTLLHVVLGRVFGEISDKDQAIIRMLLNYGANPEVQLEGRSVIDVARDLKNDSLATLLENAVRHYRREQAKREVVNLAIARGLVVKGTQVDEQLFEQLINQHAYLREIFMQLLGE